MVGEAVEEHEDWQLGVRIDSILETGGEVVAVCESLGSSDEGLVSVLVHSVGSHDD